MINVTKVRTAIEAAQKEVGQLYRDSVAAGEKDDLQLNAIKPLAKANKFLGKAIGQLEDAIERTTVKEKPAKKEKKAKN